MTWMRRCPMCQRVLHAETLEHPWVCICGWTTKKEPHEPRPDH